MIKGLHLVADFFDAKREILGDIDFVYNFLDQIPQKINMTKIMPPHAQKHLDDSDPEWGISGFVIIAESHIAIHTYPKRSYFSIDVFSCKDFDIKKTLEIVQSFFESSDFKHQVFDRGIEYPRNIKKAFNIVIDDRKKISKS